MPLAAIDRLVAGATKNVAHAELLTPPRGASRVALMRGNQELASLAGGAQAPSVTITTPKAGDIWNTGPKDLAWTGSGTGSSPLTYLVDYSSDGGVTWVPLGLETTDNRLNIDPAQIAGGARVWFRVQVSDGWNTSTAQVGPIDVVQSPRIEATPAAVDFRNGLPGMGGEREVALANTGTGPLRVSEIRFSDKTFGLLSPATPLTVPAGANLLVRIQFTPLTAGSKQGTMTVISNAANTPALSLPLQGNALGATAFDPVVTPMNVDFGRVPEGGSRTAQVTLQNFGPAALKINPVSLTGAGFSTTDSATGVTVAAGESRVFPLRFAPARKARRPAA